MSTSNPEFSCPSGGTFHACTTGTWFLGCCSSSSDPCVDGCPAADLAPMSFNKNYTHTIPDQICPVSYQYWSCHHLQSDEVPFLGCCAVDACQSTGGCAQQNLGAAKLDPAYVSFFVTTTTSSSQIASPTASPSTSASPSPGSSVPVGAVAGAVAGGVVLLIAIIAAVFFLCCTKQGKRNSRIVSERLGLMNQEKDRYSISPYNFQENRDSSPSPNANDSWTPSSIDHRISQPPAELPLTEVSRSKSKHAHNLSADIATPQAHSPALSALTASPTAPNERWSAAHSQISELAGSDVSPRPEHGSWSPPASPGRLDSRIVGEEGVRYESYRPR